MDDKYRNGIALAIGTILIVAFFAGGLWHLFNDNTGVSFVMFVTTLLSAFMLSIWYDDGMGGGEQGQC